MRENETARVERERRDAQIALIVETVSPVAEYRKSSFRELNANLMTSSREKFNEEKCLVEQSVL